MTEEHAPVRAESLEQPLPIYTLASGKKKVSDIRAVEPFRSMTKAFDQIVSSGGQNLTGTPKHFPSRACLNQPSSTCAEPAPSAMSTRRKAMARRPGVAAGIFAPGDSCGSQGGGVGPR